MEKERADKIIFGADEGPAPLFFAACGGGGAAPLTRTGEPHLVCAQGRWI